MDTEGDSWYDGPIYPTSILGKCVCKLKPTKPQPAFPDIYIPPFNDNPKAVVNVLNSTNYLQEQSDDRYDPYHPAHYIATTWRLKGKNNWWLVRF